MLIRTRTVLLQKNIKFYNVFVWFVAARILYHFCAFRTHNRKRTHVSPNTHHTSAMAENKGRQQAFKAGVKSNADGRVRRQEVTVELRKNKREDQLLKRRNIDLADIENEGGVTSPLKESNQNCQSPPAAALTIEEIFEGMKSGNDERTFAATMAARKMLSRERNPPIDVMVQHGIVPICTAFLDRFDK